MSGKACLSARLEMYLKPADPATSCKEVGECQRSIQIFLAMNKQQFGELSQHHELSLFASLAWPKESMIPARWASDPLGCFVPVKFDKLTTGRGINVAVRTLKDGYAHARMHSAG
uniref:Uncharacterized protein n=1 Tax=Thermogemmatispora argillosa TaxID=2045280 RepID=A0A455T8T3_9CHLR|nr:hypothetical protein KTA_39640 [Thermogemmatispora argillosa]